MRSSRMRQARLLKRDGLAGRAACLNTVQLRFVHSGELCEVFCCCAHLDHSRRNSDRNGSRGNIVNHHRIIGSNDASAFAANGPRTRSPAPMKQSSSTTGAPSRLSRNSMLTHGLMMQFTPILTPRSTTVPMPPLERNAPRPISTIAGTFAPSTDRISPVTLMPVASGHVHGADG